MTDGLLEVGRIGRPHGIRGGLHVKLVTDRLQRVAPGSTLSTGTEWLTVISARPLEPTKFVVQFEGLTDRTAAERLVGALLYAEPIIDDDDADSLWIHQLIGARVVEADGTDRGVCTGVLANPAHDILELDSGFLVPAVFVTAHADGVITIAPPDGLFE